MHKTKTFKFFKCPARVSRDIHTIYYREILPGAITGGACSADELVNHRKSIYKLQILGSFFQ